MHRAFPALLVVLALSGSASAAGLLIPEDKKLPPLAMVHHRVNIAIDDQVAVTSIEQAFRNHTDRQPEATYLFPIPKGASVNKFTMWVGETETTGELLDAKKASQVYTDIVRRTQDPAILEYMGNNLMRLKIFPVPPKKDQKVKISFTSVAPQDNQVVEYVYPLKTDGKGTRTLEEFSVKARIKSQHPIQNVYSPTHAIAITRNGDKEVSMTFERNQAVLDKDFQLFYSVGNKEIGITPLAHRPISSEDGYFMLLVSPQLEVSKSVIIPRDLVLVLDTSGSMDNVKMDQARKALKHCLSNLNSGDRFAIVSFSTNVRKYRDALVEANSEQLDNAKKWVDALKAGGGTAIQAALDSALEMRTKDEGRTFTVVFFTDGQPTIGEMKPEKIVRNVAANNSANTRIFTFGVGDDVNAALLDQLAENTKALSTYVRPAEDIEAKVTSLYGKISHPVLANVRLTTSENIKVFEVYPPQMPDLFFGSQLVVLGKYSGSGPAAVKIAGQVGKEPREFAYDVLFPAKTDGDREFVEHLWARRKVGFLLDQIRINGEQKELMDEMLGLAKKYGIATPYTSYLVVPDAPVPVASAPVGSFYLGSEGAPDGRSVGAGRPAGTAGGLPGPGGPGLPGSGFGGGGYGTPTAPPPALTDPNLTRGAGAGTKRSSEPAKVEDVAKEIAKKPGNASKARGDHETDKLDKVQSELEKFNKALKDMPRKKPDGADAKDEAEQKAKEELAERMLRSVKEARENITNFEQARAWYANGQFQQAQTGKVGVDVAICANNLRCQERLTETANRLVQGRNCLELGGLWIDEGYTADMKTLVVKAQSNAYFKILDKNPKMKDVFRLGNHLVFVTPSKTALIVDTSDGKAEMTDDEVTALFAAKAEEKKADKKDEKKTEKK
ncbi:MAG TPA: VIT domain-containing protein [Gemmataceae bacterium]|nr:VIT domain-containing protein [Gemmataceae bacterium]